MQLEDKKIGPILMVRPLERRIDASSASDFKGKLLDRIQEGNESIILDLSEVDFLDSSALGAIVSSMKSVGNKGDFVICGVRDAVQNLFTLTRMNKIFQVFGSSDEAVATISARRGVSADTEGVKVLRLALASQISNVSLVGQALNGIVSANGLSAIASQIEVCVVEALTAIIEQAYGGAPAHEIEVLIFVSGDRLTLQVCDSGKNLSAKDAAGLNAPTDQTDTPSEKNMGLFIIKSVMDDVRYKSSAGKNVLTMSKKIDPGV